MLPPAELLRHALALPEEARAELARRLLDTLAPPLDEDPALWVAEVERRTARFIAGDSEGVPAEEVFRQATALLDGRRRR